VTATAPPSDAKDRRILTVPNLISLARLLCVPVFLHLLFGVEDRHAAAWLLGALGATDWVDGWIARRFDQGSDLGKVLDPIADRAVLFVGVVGILVDGSVPAWFAVLTLLREGLIGIAAVVLGALGARRIDVTWWGKTGTFLLMFAFPLFLASEADLNWSGIARVLAWACGIPGLAIHWYSAAGYVPAARAALREGRSARSGAQVETPEHPIR